VEHPKKIKDQSSYLKVKDHSVSEEIFELKYNIELDMLETFPKPEAESLDQYYKSESYISHTNSKRNWFEKCYHLVRSIAVKNKVTLINNYKEGKPSLLDIGTGTGNFLEAAQKSNWKITGIEPNTQARSIANSKCDNKVFDISELRKFKANSFTVITMWHVLEHISDLKGQIEELKRLLKPDGALIIAVPNFKSFDAKHYKEYWAAFDVPRHLWHFSKTAIKLLFSEYNMQVVKTKPMLFDAFYVSLLSEKYKTGKMNIINGFLIGLLSNLKAIKTKEYSSLIYVIKNTS
jgi:ubiquinone/menaquinone biosynthesis C-methylase UbiE